MQNSDKAFPAFPGLTSQMIFIHYGFFSLQLLQDIVKIGPSGNNERVINTMEHPSRKNMLQSGDFPSCLHTGQGKVVSSAVHVCCPCPSDSGGEEGDKAVLSCHLFILSHCNCHVLIVMWSPFSRLCCRENCR